MSARTVLAAVVAGLIALQPGAASAQGFAGLGTDSEGFTAPKLGQALEFPRDFGAHPDFRIEWWYLTANLRGEDGKDYGVQWTLFRSALKPQESANWSSQQVWLGNAALTTPDHHYVAERLARGGIGQAGVTAQPFAAWIDDWRLESRIDAPAGGEANLGRLDMKASGPDFSYQLRLDTSKPLVLHGDQGFSVKSTSGQASYYYSQPYYAVQGVLTLPGGPVKVTGQAWLDREWSSQPLAADQTGWDWFSLHFDTGEKLMAFRLRDAGGGYTSGTWIAADGTTTPLAPGEVTMTALDTAEAAGHVVPVRWRLTVPSHGVEVDTKALNSQAWMKTLFPYWEGPIAITGTHGGRGYLEMTGYK